LILLLLCLSFEAFTAFKFNASVGVEGFLSEIYEKFKEKSKTVEDLGKEDFHLFLDQLSERLLTKMGDGKPLPFEIKAFQQLNPIRKSSQEAKDFSAAVDAVIKSGEDATEFIKESTDKLGELAGEQLKKNFFSLLGSFLNFALFLLALLILLLAVITSRLDVLFAWPIQIVLWIKEILT
jgi:hypothetical protein